MIVSKSNADWHCSHRKRLRETLSNHSISRYNRNFLHTSVLLLSFAVTIEFSFVESIQLNNPEGAVNNSAPNNAVCVLDRYRELDSPISFEECPSIETLSGKNNGLSASKDVDLNFHWIFRYIDEFTTEFKVMFIEHSIDERISNLQYVKKLLLMYDPDWFRINQGDPQKDKLYEQYSAGKVVNGQLCVKQLTSMLSQLKELNSILENKRTNNQTAPKVLKESHIRLARVLESYGHYDSGVFLGRHIFPGSSSQCSGSQMMLDSDKPESKTSSRYCTAHLKIDKHLSPKIKSREKHNFEPDANFWVGICLPESCHSKSFKQNKEPIQALVDSQFKLPTSLYLEENLEVEFIFCGVDGDSYLAKIPISGWLFIMFIICWISLVLFATIYKYKNSMINSQTDSFKEDWISRAIDSLDLTRSWENFKQKKEKDKNYRVQLNVINPIKVICCMYVVYAHSSLAVMFANSLNMPQFIHWGEGLSSYYMSLVTSNIIDTSFVITGLLMTYFIHKRHSKSRQDQYIGEEKLRKFKILFEQYINVVFARYLRLLPVYFLVFWFNKSLFHLVGSGPNWDYGSNMLTMVGACRHETWLSPFILIPAFSQPNRQCLPQAWTVATDLFFCTLLSPVLLLMIRKPILAIATLLSVSLLSTTALYIKFIRTPESLLEDMLEIRADAIIRAYMHFPEYYVAPHYRLVSFSIGSIAGYLLYKYNKSSDKQWPHWFKGAATKLSWLFILTLFLTAGSYPFLVNTPLVTEFKIQRFIFKAYMTIIRLMWSIANSIILMRMVTDWKDSRLMRAFSGRFWRAMSKLNYAFLLLHLNVILYDIGTAATSLDYFSFRRCLFNFRATYMQTALISLVIYVAFESPIDKFSKFFLYPKRKKLDLNNSDNSVGKVERILMTTNESNNVELDLDNVITQDKC